MNIHVNIYDNNIYADINTYVNTHMAIYVNTHIGIYVNTRIGVTM